MRSQRMKIGVSILILLSLAMPCYTPVSAYRGSILSPFSQNDVVIDGKWTSASEWTDGSELEITSFWKGSGRVIIRTKHDADYLYVLVDFVSDKTDNKEKGKRNDNCALNLDCDHDAALTPQKDDFRLGCSFDNKPPTKELWFQRGDGSESWPAVYPSVPEGVLMDSSMDATNNPYDKQAHRIYESRIPKKYFKEDAVGFYVWIRDGEGDAERINGNWPGGKYDVPGEWAELKFSKRLLSDMANLKTFMFPVKDVELTYAMNSSWYLSENDRIFIQDTIVLKPIKVEAPLTEIQVSVKKKIQGAQGTSSIHTFFYARNGSAIDEFKKIGPVLELEYESIYVLDGKEIKDIKGDEVYYSRTRFTIAGNEYTWTIYDFGGANFFWSAQSQEGKFIQIWNLDPVRLQSGEEYEFGGKKLRTLKGESGSKSGDWTYTYSWVWEKDTGILLSSTQSGERPNRGWKISCDARLLDVKRVDTNLSLYAAPSVVAPGKTVKILGAVSVLGSTTLKLVITDPKGVAVEKTIDTDASGEFELPLTFDQEGQYGLKAEWAGTTLHESTKSKESGFSVTSVTQKTTTQPTTPQPAAPTGMLVIVLVIVIAGALVVVAVFIKKRKRSSSVAEEVKAPNES